MSAPNTPTDADLEAIISSNLNSGILFIFLMGMYTVIYFGTIYVYLTKNPSKYHPVPVAITMLYLSSILYTAIQWYSTKWQFVDNGDTRQSVFLSLFIITGWMGTLLDISSCISYVIADGLLIWRCFHVWNRSFSMTSVPLLFILSEFALFLAGIALVIKYPKNLNISPALAATFDNVNAAGSFVSFGTTLVTTVLIAYKIYSVLNQQGASSKRFRHIVDIVVQSGAVYALSQLAAAIANVLPASTTLDTRTVAFGNYMDLLAFASAGISPTVMVARVALLAEDTTYPSTSVHLSGLQFHAHSTHPTANVEAMGTTRSVDSDPIAVGEGQTVEDKVQ